MIQKILFECNYCVSGECDHYKNKEEERCNCNHIELIHGVWICNSKEAQAEFLKNKLKRS